MLHGEPVGEPHLVHDALPVVGSLKAAQRAEAADRQQLEVGRLAGAQVDAPQRRRARDQRVALVAAREQVDQLTAVCGAIIAARHALARPARGVPATLLLASLLRLGRVQAALGLVLAGPAAGAGVLAGHHLAGAVRAADRRVVLVVQRVVGDVVARGCTPTRP